MFRSRCRPGGLARGVRLVRADRTPSCDTLVTACLRSSGSGHSWARRPCLLPCGSSRAAARPPLPHSFFCGVNRVSVCEAVSAPLPVFLLQPSSPLVSAGDVAVVCAQPPLGPSLGSALTARGSPRSAVCRGLSSLGPSPAQVLRVSPAQTEAQF